MTKNRQFADALGCTNLEVRVTLMSRSAAGAVEQCSAQGEGSFATMIVELKHAREIIAEVRALSPSLRRQLVSLDDQIACVTRELEMRRAVYPRLVANKKMRQATAGNEQALMRSILELLKFLKRSVDDAPGNPAEGVGQ